MARKRKSIHELIRSLREAANLSQRDLALKLKVDETAVSHWETGKSAPKRARLAQVAKALGVSTDDLLEGWA